LSHTFKAEFAVYYKKSVYINFEKNELAKKLFKQDFDIWRILKSISLMEDMDIDEQTLLIFDEIQEVSDNILCNYQP
jgi:predicted AAA+ superfamily ATPase